MSYILDALKKSEQKRRQGAVPDLLTVHDRPASETGKRVWWPYLLSGALLLGAAMVTAGLYRAHQDISYKAPVPMQATPPQYPQTALPTASPVQAHATAGLAQPVQTETSSPAAVRMPDREADMKVVDKPASEALIQHREVQSASKQAVLREYELPPAIQQEIPKINISAHFYDSDPSARIVSIHGNVIHEGQDVAAGLRLERITPDGVILNYRDYRFYRPAFQDK